MEVEETVETSEESSQEESQEEAQEETSEEESSEEETSDDEDGKQFGLSAAELQIAANLYNTLNSDSDQSRRVVQNLANNLGMGLEKETKKEGGDVDEVNIDKLVEKHIPAQYASLRPMFKNLMEDFKSSFVDTRFESQSADRHTAMANTAYDKLAAANKEFGKYQEEMTELAKKFPPAENAFESESDYEEYFAMLYTQVSGKESSNVNGRVGKAMEKIVKNSKKSGLRPSDGRKGKSGSARPTLQQALDAAAKGVKL